MSTVLKGIDGVMAAVGNDLGCSDWIEIAAFLVRSSPGQIHPHDSTLRRHHSPRVEARRLMAYVWLTFIGG